MKNRSYICSALWLDEAKVLATEGGHVCLKCEKQYSGGPEDYQFLEAQSF